MASIEEIEPPYLLASLPRPIDSANGRAIAAGVYGLRGSRRRKRFETVVGIDGEGINIYNVQNPRLLTSHAIPPHAYFVSSPTSIYQKAALSRPARRYTYASIAHSYPARSKPQIVCFREDARPASVGDAEKFTLDVSTRQSDVAAIEAVSFDVDGEPYSHDVLVIYKDGSIECVTADLQTILWTANLEGVVSGPNKFARSKTVVEHVSVTSSDVARRSMLKGRDDVAALLDSSLKRKVSQSAVLPFICIVSCTTSNNQVEGHRRALHLLSLRPSSVVDVAVRNSKIQHLITWQLPLTKEISPAPAVSPQFSLHFGTGTLQQLTSGVIVTYEFTGTSPKIASVFQSPNGSIKSFARLSPSLALVVSPGHIGLYDVRYNSLQAVLSYSPGNNVEAETKKRKRTSSSISIDRFSTVTYLSEIGVIVGLADKDLVGIQLAEKLYVRERQGRASLLANSISKGVSHVDPHYRREPAAAVATPFIHKVVATKPTDSWTQQRKLLDEFARKGDIFNFERVFAEAVEISRSATKAEMDTAQTENNGEVLANSDGQKSSHATDLSGVDSERASLLEWEFVKDMTGSERIVHRPKATFALAKIFEWSPATPSFESETSKSPIRIRFLPPNVFRWLLFYGYLSRDLIERSLHDTYSLQERTGLVHDGDIVTSVYNYDRKMILLYSMLNSKASLGINEIVRAIQIIIHSLDTASPAHPASGLLIKDVAEEASNNFDAFVDEEMEAATNAVDQALETLENGVLIRSRTLRPALIKLHSFPRPLIVEAFRAALDHHDLIFLVNLLRIELADGGWTSRYFADSISEPTAETDNPSDAGIVIIGNLLSCALDAIGLGGWLIAATNTSADEDAQDDVIELLRQEISAALEGIHEATFMKGLLAEFLRFCHRDAHTQKPPTPGESRLRERPFLVSKQDSDYEALQNRLLPLGLRPLHAAQEMWKRDHGGEWKPKSSREIGQAISRQVPKYSNENILL